MKFWCKQLLHTYWTRVKFSQLLYQEFNAQIKLINVQFSYQQRWKSWNYEFFFHWWVCKVMRFSSNWLSWQFNTHQGSVEQAKTALKTKIVVRCNGKKFEINQHLQKVTKCSFYGVNDFFFWKKFLKRSFLIVLPKNIYILIFKFVNRDEDSEVRKNDRNWKMLKSWKPN